MAAAHGAGVMLIPAINGLSIDGPSAAEASDLTMGYSHHHQHMSETGTSLVTALAAVLIHTLAMVAAMGVIALIVYRWIGVEVLRRAWINFDLVWVSAMALTGVFTVAIGSWSMLT